MGIYDDASNLNYKVRQQASRTNDDYQRQYDFYKTRDEAGPTIDEIGKMEGFLNRGLPQELQSNNIDGRNSIKRGSTFGQTLDRLQSQSKMIALFKAESSNYERRIQRKEGVIKNRAAASRTQADYTMGIYDRNRTYGRQNAADARAAAAAKARKKKYDAEAKLADFQTWKLQNEAERETGYILNSEGKLVQQIDKAGSRYTASSNDFVDSSMDSNSIGHSMKAIAEGGKEKDSQMGVMRRLMETLKSPKDAKGKSREIGQSEKDIMTNMMMQGAKNLPHDELKNLGSGFWRGLADTFTSKAHTNKVRLRETAELIEKQNGIPGFADLVEDSGVIDTIVEGNGNSTEQTLNEFATHSQNNWDGGLGFSKFESEQFDSNIKQKMEESINSFIEPVDVHNQELSENELASAISFSPDLASNTNNDDGMVIKELVKANGNKIPSYSNLPEEVKLKIPENRWMNFEKSTTSYLKEVAKDKAQLEATFALGDMLGSQMSPEGSKARAKLNSILGEHEVLKTSLDNLYKNSVEAEQAYFDGKAKGMIKYNPYFVTDRDRTSMTAFKAMIGIQDIPDKELYKALKDGDYYDSNFLQSLGEIDKQGTFRARTISSMEDEKERQMFDFNINKIRENHLTGADNLILDEWSWGSDFDELIEDLRDDLKENQNE